MNKTYIDSTIFIEFFFNSSNQETQRDIFLVFQDFHNNKRIPCTSYTVLNEIRLFVENEYKEYPIDKKAEIYREAIKGICELPIYFYGLPTISLQEKISKNNSFTDTSIFLHIATCINEGVETVLTYDQAMLALNIKNLSVTNPKGVFNRD